MRQEGENGTSNARTEGHLVGGLLKAGKRVRTDAQNDLEGQ
jgi:hypothetical protein